MLGIVNILMRLLAGLRSRVLDTGDQNLKEERRIRLEEPIVNTLPVLGGGLGKLVGISCRKNFGGRQNNPSKAILVHSHHGFLQGRRELPTTDRPGNLVEFRVGLGRKILDTPRLVSCRKGLATNRHLSSNLGAIGNHCSIGMWKKIY